MALYSVHNRMAGTQQALTTTFKTMANLIGATTRRAQLWEASFGADGAPNATDCQIVWDIASKDATTAGTGTSATIQKLNPADGAAQLTASVNYTAEPTTFTSLMSLALNQRASQRWVAFGENQAIIMPATLNFGLAVRALSPTYVNNGLANLIFAET
jgi:hypothetical protein